MDKINDYIDKIDDRKLKRFLEEIIEFERSVHDKDKPRFKEVYKQILDKIISKERNNGDDIK